MENEYISQVMSQLVHHTWFHNSEMSSVSAFMDVVSGDVAKDVHGNHYSQWACHSHNHTQLPRAQFVIDPKSDDTITKMGQTHALHYTLHLKIIYEKLSVIFQSVQFALDDKLFRQMLNI